MDSYRQFLSIKGLPRYRLVGRTAYVPVEYAGLIGKPTPVLGPAANYTPIEAAFDYQAGITRIAIAKEKFAIFARCGLGKTLMILEWVKHVASQLRAGQCVLIIEPLMVVRQLIEQAAIFYGDSLPIERVPAAKLAEWLASGTGRIGVTNYDALNDDVQPGRLGALAIDESSCLKSHYGAWGQHILRIGRGLRWKLALTGTPAPNDRIEYANHAVFLDRYPTVNAFLARYFVNRGQTDNRWELKPHALRPFYRSLSDWCIFVNNPGTYGWKDNTDTIPPVHVHIENVGLTEAQRRIVADTTGQMFVGSNPGGIGDRAKMGQLAKGKFAGEAVDTLKPAYIRDRIASWPNESTIVWCLYNDEQDRLAKIIPNSASMTGSTPDDERERMIDDFNAGRVRTLISKPKILGYGMNFQIATRHVFSGLQDSYEQFHQAVSRSNRIGSTKPLNVHIPVTEIERPMIDTVLRKAKRIDEETAEQEDLFRESAAGLIHAN